MKHLLWKVAKNYLPTVSNLSHKKVEVNPAYPVCMVHEETVEYILLQCPFAQQVWQLQGVQAVRPHDNSFKEWLTYMLLIAMSNSSWWLQLGSSGSIEMRWCGSTKPRLPHKW